MPHFQFLSWNRLLLTIGYRSARTNSCYRVLVCLHCIVFNWTAGWVWSKQVSKRPIGLSVDRLRWCLPFCHTIGSRPPLNYGLRTIALKFLTVIITLPKYPPAVQAPFDVLSGARCPPCSRDRWDDELAVLFIALRALIICRWRILFLCYNPTSIDLKKLENVQVLYYNVLCTVVILQIQCFLRSDILDQWWGTTHFLSR